MSDPTRLLDQIDDVSDDERRALNAGRDVRPPPGFSGDVWGALALQLPPSPPLDPTGGGSAAAGGSAGVGAGSTAAGVAGAKVAGSAGLVSIVKAAVIGAAFGTAVLAGRAVVPSSSSPATAPKDVQESAPLRIKPSPADLAGPTILPSVSEGDHSPTLEPTPQSREAAGIAGTSQRSGGGDRDRAKMGDRSEARPAEPSSARSDPFATAPRAPSPERAGDGREETRMVAAARDALRLGDPASGLVWLERAEREFPNGVLVQEREALTIEALARSGRRAEAEKRAASFLRDYPKSPHAARVEAIVR
jgi:hypothetical protein